MINLKAYTGSLPVISRMAHRRAEPASSGSADPYSSVGGLPNKNDDEGAKMLAVLWTLITFSTSVVGARVWSKWKSAKRLYSDDSIMLVALVLGLLQAIQMTVSIHYGLGRHFVYLSTQEQYHAVLHGMIGMAWGNLSPMAGRVAFCITMLFLTETDKRVPAWPIWVTIGGQLVLNIAAVIFFLSQCGTHLSSLIESNYEEAALYCLDPRLQTDFGYFVGAFNCLTDFYLTVLPAVLISHTRLSMKKKTGLAFLLCLSILALTAAVVKTYEAKALSELLDYTYDLCDYVIWVSTELNVVIIVASVPILRVLFQRKKQPDEINHSMRWDASSVFSRGRNRGSKSHLSMSSEENIIQHDRPKSHELSMLAGQIQVTREVEVSYEYNDAPYVHAALVGLIQTGVDIPNPTMVRPR